MAVRPARLVYTCVVIALQYYMIDSARWKAIDRVGLGLCGADHIEIYNLRKETKKKKICMTEIMLTDAFIVEKNIILWIKILFYGLKYIKSAVPCCWSLCESANIWIWIVWISVWIIMLPTSHIRVQRRQGERFSVFIDRLLIATHCFETRICRWVLADLEMVRISSKLYIFLWLYREFESPSNRIRARSISNFILMKRFIT